jgi:hypothetical protein
MREENNSARLAELERELLRALCVAPGTPAFKTAAQELAGYEWQGYENRVVFQALRRIADHGSRSLREELAAHTTRAGFPDVDWSFYFQSPAARTDIPALLQDLKRLAG